LQNLFNNQHLLRLLTVVVFTDNYVIVGRLLILRVGEKRKVFEKRIKCTFLGVFNRINFYPLHKYYKHR